MAEKFSLRCYCYLDRMQPQFAAFIGTVTQGDLPTEGMAALYVEMSPGNEVFRMVDIAVKATEARPGAQIVEREFGMFEMHSPNQAAVLEAGECGPFPFGIDCGRSDQTRGCFHPGDHPHRPIPISTLKSIPPRFHVGSGRNLAGTGMCSGSVYQLRLQRSRKESQHQALACFICGTVWTNVVGRIRI